MKLLRIIIPIGVLYLTHILAINPYDISFNSASHQADSEIFTDDEMPKAYLVNITFEDEDYDHIYTVDNGSYQIDIIVKGSFDYLTTGKLHQIYCNLTCDVSSIDGNVDGIIKINRVISVIGDKDEDELREALQKNIIEIIKYEIQKT